MFTLSTITTKEFFFVVPTCRTFCFSLNSCNYDISFHKHEIGHQRLHSADKKASKTITKEEKQNMNERLIELRKLFIC